MRLLFVSNLYPPNTVGGYERLCADVAAAMVRRGHAVSVLTSNFGDTPAQPIDGQSVYRTLLLIAGASIYQPYAGTPEQRQALDRHNVTEANRVIAAERPQAIFCWNLFFLDGSLLHALAQSGLPMLAMLTDNWLINMRRPDYVPRFFARHVWGGEPFPPAPRGAFWRRLLRRAPPPQQPETLPFAALFGARFVQAMYRDAGFRFARETVIHNGVDQNAAWAAEPPDRTRLVRPDGARLLFAGRLVDLKGAHTAVAALPMLDPAARLTIVGDTQDSAYVARLHGDIARLGVGDRIDFANPVAEAALPALFAAHDLYLFPSLYEPFSLTLVHALANGIPTVASDAGGNVEIVRDRETGLLFRKGDPGDLARAVATLLADPALRAAAAAGGREAARGYTFEIMTERMERLLEDLR
jgi:glycosyltransferase involved in cell wall biosynthesis